jgi:hypothetical protein
MVMTYSMVGQAMTSCEVKQVVTFSMAARAMTISMPAVVTQLMVGQAMTISLSTYQQRLAT